MREDILKKLFESTEEEKQILEGKKDVDKSIYTDDRNKGSAYQY